MFKPSALVVVLASMLAAGAAHAQQSTLAFTAIPDEDETRLVERFTQYAKHFVDTKAVSVIWETPTYPD